MVDDEGSTFKWIRWKDNMKKTKTTSLIKTVDPLQRAPVDGKHENSSRLNPNNLVFKSSSGTLDAQQVKTTRHKRSDREINQKLQLVT